MSDRPPKALPSWQSESASTAGLPTPRRYQAIIAICFGTALIIVDGSIPNVALPTIANDFRIEPSAAILVVTVYQLILVMTLLPFANLGDQLGHRKVYQYGLVIFTIGTALCFFARSLPFLLIVRAVQALGASAALSVLAGLIRAIYPSHQLGRGLAINSVVASSAGVLAPTLGGIILSFASWPWIFAVAIPFALLSLAAVRALPDPEPRAHSFDVLGAVLCAATFGMIIVGIESAVHGDSPVISLAIVVAGIFVGTFFVRRELGEPRPILPVDLLKRPIVALSTAGAFAAFIAVVMLMLWLPFRLQQTFDFSPVEIGALLAPFPLTMLFVSPAAGMLSDRVPAGLLGGIGMTIATAAFLLIAFLPAEPRYFDIAWRMSLCGIGFGMFLSPNARVILGSAPIERAAPAGSMVSMVRLLGQTSGATFTAALLSAGFSGGRTPALVAAGLAVIAGLCSVARLRPSVSGAGPADM